MAVPEAVGLVDLALKAVSAYDRPDLTPRLTQAKTRLTDPAVRVLVVGEFKQGKSQLVNALVNATVCPVDDDIATAVPTLVRFGEDTTVTLVREEAGDERAERTPVPLEQLADHVSEGGNPGNRSGLTRAEVTLPRKLLQSGLVLVDTPGVGGLGSAHGAATMSALPTADAVLLVSDASQEYTSPEIDFLQAARKLCPNVACVVTKTDLYPHWRRIVELDEGHLRNARIEADLLPVSSALRLHAARTQDLDLIAESGFQALVSFLLRKVVSRADDLSRRSTSQDVLVTCQSLESSMRAELMSQNAPEKAGALAKDLEAARSRVDALRQRSARWQTSLNDGVADLIADIEYDLRDRLRAVSRDAEQLLEDADPADIWEQFAEWFHKQVSHAVAQNFVWTTERARWLAEQVADHFAEDIDVQLPDLRIAGGAVAGKVDALELPASENFGPGQKLFVGMRGGYGGLLMLGLASTFAGFALLNPLSIGAGLLFGAKTVRDEKKRLVQRRQADSKNAVRRHIDEVTFQVGKDSRDNLRQIQRELRDHFTVLAEELSESLKESVTAAQTAMKDDKERQKRVADLEAELERVGGLAERARSLAATVEASS
ncbi:isoniazid inducible gene protein Inia [Pseudonocardia sp. Ae168_Ps1]|uniref:dynamin family protein n=1 Tax=unclassified Pseudonocardia TaxID=2619320 RepID=UPI00094B0AA8|nr:MULTISPECIES: dynamin family protein [unclassified Pseudonocardia]OLL74931.1 isoniazid inducible gene protein Inia [Pseudonocardia sp. Ae150A_Ps1]OLL80922.1 isoniazid inducible gene protein Inia [Pseudonocardia sp. Ae168_Ps1]OLL84959.1 isoniazid inducible gene protein Inia [Pseudonocardia sp. Ae263_Ps1]OLL95024.1 isoniazid inducible gene protein Inia [Pseudonocardia sp. Ae356_Ps1]